jgi:hypothetical protein
LREKEVPLLDGINGERPANGFAVLTRNAVLDAAARLRRLHAPVACERSRLRRAGFLKAA